MVSFFDFSSFSAIISNEGEIENNNFLSRTNEPIILYPLYNLPMPKYIFTIGLEIPHTNPPLCFGCYEAGTPR